MGTYIIRRLLWVLVLLFAVTALTFVVFTVLPSADPALLRAGRQPSPQLVEQIRKNFGLDRPKYEQFCNYVGDISPVWFFDCRNRHVLGIIPSLKTPDVKAPDFGFSYQNDTPVIDQITSRLPATIGLTVGAVLIWLLIGLTVGTISAIKSRSLVDRLSMGAALIAISAPVYWLGLVSLFLFSNDIGKVHIFRGAGSYQPITDGVFGWAAALVLPWLVLAAAFSAFYARLLRGNLIETMSEDYIRTARAKGLNERRVIFRHGMRSAITPIVTILGLDIGILLGGAILTESVFNIPGIGRLAYDSIARSDLPVIQGTVLFGAFFIVIMNLIVDIAYAFLDPRVRY
ncbi:MAG TPA: ABC transporter permease [Solirubrobacteraceae bacterium]|jgi:peptide/nickel transport system permease protein